MTIGLSDPFLDDHEVAPSCFDLTGRYTPGSIRDQMLRACFLVQRLNERAKLAGRSVLIVGMGACGVTAGIEAARVGARVTMIEKNATPFSAQRMGASRWIDPTLYDWPLQHWQIGNFPPSPGTHTPLQWRGGPAFAVQADWLHQLREAESTLAPNLQLMYSTAFQHILLRPKGSIRVTTSTGESTRTKSYHYVVFCHGFGEEITTIGQYVGRPFWAPQTEGAGASDGGEILVIGGGDGALQDFLIAVTGERSAGKLLEAILPPDVRNSVSSAIQSAEDQAQRSLLWSPDASHDHPIFQELERVHDTAVSSALGNAAVRPALTRAIIPGRKVTIAHTCSHFSRAYALNRFLTLLILRHSEDSGMITRTKGVRASNAETSEDRQRVTFVSASCGAQDANKPDTLEFPGIIVRAGQRPAPGITRAYESGRARRLNPPRPVRQSLPYYLSA